MSTFTARALTRAIRDLGYPYVSVRTRAIGPDVFEMRLPPRTAEELGLHPRPGPGNDPERAQRLLSRQLGGPVEVIGVAEGTSKITVTLRGSLPGFPPAPAGDPGATRDAAEAGTEPDSDQIGAALDGDHDGAEPVCESCGSTRPMTVGAIPARARGGGLLPAWEFRECPDCGRRFPRFPRFPTAGHTAAARAAPGELAGAVASRSALAGESHNITAARRSLTCFAAAAAAAVADEADRLAGDLASAGLDPQTLDDVTVIVVAAADLGASAGSALARLSSRHQVMEQAHAATAQPARNSFYQPGR